jgi:hypothetical protein
VVADPKRYVLLDQTEAVMLNFKRSGSERRGGSSSSYTLRML